MFVNGHELKVFRPVVRFVFVFVVNNFPRSQPPADHLLHNQDVFANIFLFFIMTGFSDNYVSVAFGDAALIMRIVFA